MVAAAVTLAVALVAWYAPSSLGRIGGLWGVALLVLSDAVLVALVVHSTRWIRLVAVTTSGALVALVGLVSSLSVPGHL